MWSRPLVRRTRTSGCYAEALWASSAFGIVPGARLGTCRNSLTASLVWRWHPKSNLHLARFHDVFALFATLAIHTYAHTHLHWHTHTHTPLHTHTHTGTHSHTLAHTMIQTKDRIITFDKVSPRAYKLTLQYFISWLLWIIIVIVLALGLQLYL